VRTLNLRGADETALRHGAILLEDALRTASFPSATGSRLLVIRTLDMGQIDPRGSPSTLALTLAERLRQVGITAVHATNAAAARASAVYFHDNAEPYSLLSIRLARRQPAVEWFWPLAIPGWQPAVHTWRELLYGVMRTHAGVLATAVLLRVLHEQDLLDVLLPALQAQDGGQLLRYSGWSQPAPAIRPLGSPPPLTARWYDLVRSWSQRWGVRDNRSAWLVGAVLVAERPALLLDTHLPRRIAGILSALARGTFPPGPHTDTPGLFPLEPEALAAPTPGTSQLPVSALWSAARLATETPSLLSPQAAPVAADVPRDRARADTSGRPSVQPPVRTALSEVSDPADTPGQDVSTPWEGVGQPSAFAGLFLLMPLLKRLGMEQFLAAHPEWIEADLPVRLLHYMAQRVKVPRSDPALQPFEMPAGESVQHTSFVVPLVWQELFQGQTWSIHTGTNGQRLLYDGSRRLVLALWQGGIPEAVGRLCSACRLVEGAPFLTPLDPDLFLQTWLGIMRRWLRRFGHLGLRSLIVRPGQVVATRTHIDILFHHRLVDMRIRRVGLDFDPGWVPWLGKVIAFHYLYDED
jgi:hypothetical protein